MARVEAGLCGELVEMTSVRVRIGQEVLAKGRALGARHVNGGNGFGACRNERKQIRIDGRKQSSRNEEQKRGK